MITFAASKKEVGKIDAIVTRAENMGLCNDRISGQMDITACHLNGCKLDLDKFYGFDDFNFAHDFAGIQNHLDRETGALTQHFLPRCAKPQNGETVR